MESTTNGDDEQKTHGEVSAYYGKELQSSQDLKTDACCTSASFPPEVRRALEKVHPEVKNRYYGCGLVAPPLLKGKRILDLGSGSGQDCYVLAQLAGEEGFVLGVDMTDEQLEIAREYQDWHRETFGFEKSNVEFRKGYIENLEELGLESNSFDIVVSNCVINLVPDKEKVLREVWRVLKPGGEMHFSDVYSDRRIPEELRKDPVLYGECLSGALYWNDFLNIARKSGFAEPRLVEDRPLGIHNPEIEKKLKGYRFFSATYSLFKLQGMEPECEDYGQTACYMGGISENHSFRLDKEHLFDKDREVSVCGNTFRILSETRYGEYFDCEGDFKQHLGIFNCDCSPRFPFSTSAKNSDSCCTPQTGSLSPLKQAPLELGGFNLVRAAGYQNTDQNSCSDTPGCCSPKSPAVDKETLQKIEERRQKVGYIQPHALEELWFHTGTRCNLKCLFCLEGAGPAEDRLEQLTLRDVMPYIHEADAMGVRQFSFTGGEPFVNPEFMEILDYALERRPCLILTNGTGPLQHKYDELKKLQSKKHSLSFRISLDSADSEKHDRFRGKGNFKKALQSLKALHEMGFEISVARHMEEAENTPRVNEKYMEVFAQYGLPAQLRIVPFPDFQRPGALPEGVPLVSEDCMTRFQTEASRKNFMCAFSKMIIKRKGELKVSACTLVDDDPSYDQSGSLSEALKTRIMFHHHRCYQCYSQGSSCSELM
jgi:ubiquinone/menaquinone biosynthesis C-methylase UbiE/sulfatase maturation enzyme AslB (radical SAM superfamily)